MPFESRRGRQLERFEPLQQEQMILQYVRVHGQITRNQAAELCGLSPDQASRVLRRLVSANKLGQQGENKGRVYVLHGKQGSK